MALILQGAANQRVAATALNERSSRSHSVFSATIESHGVGAGGLAHMRRSNLNLVDLAGK